MKLKLQRSYAKRELPLTDATGKPFTFAYTDEVLRLSEAIGRRTGGLEANASHPAIGEDDEGDLTYFILHQLRTFMRALDDFEAYVTSKIAQARDINELLRDASGTLNERQMLLIDWFLREDVVRVVAKEVSHRFDVSGQTARKDLKGLEALGLLTATAGRRPTVWTVPRDLNQRLAHVR